MSDTTTTDPAPVERDPPRNPGEAAGTPAAAVADPAPVAEPAAPADSPFKQRLGVLTREKYEAQRERDLAKQEADELRARIASMAPPAAQGTPPAGLPQAAAALPAGVTPADIQRLASAEAKRIVEQQEAAKTERERADSWTKMIATGQEKYTPAAFDAACSDLASLGAGDNRAFIDAIAAADNGAAVLHYLGSAGQSAEAARILALPPSKMAYEIAKLEAKATAPSAKQVSRAPAPIAPLSGNAAQTGDIYDPSLTSAQYSELRNKQLKRA